VWAGTQYWRDYVWISSDPNLVSTRGNFGARATFLGSAIHGNAQTLGTNQGYHQSLAVTLPAGIDGPKYVYVVLVRDFGNPFDTGGNYQVEPFMGLPDDPYQRIGQTGIQVIYREPDLIPSAPSAIPTNPHAGSNLTVNWTVTNQGNRDTRVESWVDGVFL